MNLPDTFEIPCAGDDPYYGLSFGIHMHWDKENNWQPCIIQRKESLFICHRYSETDIFRRQNMLKIYIDSYLKDFLKDYE